MQLVLSAIAAGGLTGAADQYACLLVVSIAARAGWITLTPQMDFMSGWWFIAVVAVFWILTNAPAYASLLSPGVMNAINTVTNFLSAFLVPLSSAMMSLAAAGIIGGMNPDLAHLFETLQIFNTAGGVGPTGAAIAVTSGASALALTGMKGLAKPALSTATGTVGTVSAPVYSALENLAAVVLMVLAYGLAQIDPWLLVALGVIVALGVLVMLGLALRQLWKVKKGIGKMLDFAQQHPRAGLSVAVEGLVWGIGWFVWGYYGRGVLMLLAWVIWLLAFFVIQPLFVGLFVFFPPAMPVAGFFSVCLLVGIFLLAGFSSAGKLMRTIEPQVEATRLKDLQSGA
ncbi:MAG TPA: DUF4126 domain-containing protein [Anaerolineaceae bacterium]|nr:DUF4126 domain-containing protein [Anaerolineaceae bacterium]HPN53166.1 DUF4126 domain-containing protein [Anaerolineaceae bacterium]